MLFLPTLILRHTRMSLIRKNNRELTEHMVVLLNIREQQHDTINYGLASRFQILMIYFNLFLSKKKL
jgi:hypothetical protein